MKGQSAHSLFRIPLPVKPDLRCALLPPLQIDGGRVIRTTKGAPNIIFQLIEDPDVRQRAEMMVR